MYAAAFSQKIDGFIPEGSSFNTNDFFEAALHRSYSTAKKASAVPGHISTGDKLVFFTGGTNGDACCCLVTRIHEDETSARHLKLHPLNGDTGDILMPEQAVGKVLFGSEKEGREFLASNANEFKEYSEILYKQLTTTASAQDDTFKKVTISADRVMEANNGIWVTPKNAEHEQIFIPNTDALRTDTGYSLTLGCESKYTIKTGQYKYSVSGRGAAHILSTSKTVAAQSARSTAAGAQGAAAVGSAGIRAAAASVPPIEPVSATVKTVLSAAAGAAGAGTSLSQGTLDLTRRL